MHPALSVIFFTTLSGAGLGLLMLLGALWFTAPGPFEPPLQPVPYVVGAALLAIGLFSSTLHLGKPLRAWRAFSQWRSSWLSREGVVSVVTFVPALVMAYATFLGRVEVLAFWAAALVVLAALAVLCTSRIYDTLKAVPAWRDAWVLPNYATLALLTGALWCAALATVTRGDAAAPAPIVLVLAILAAVAKLVYWRRIDRKAMPTSTGSLTGLERFGAVRAFESPHTETNYLLREMGFVLARKHAQKLRRIAFVLAFGVPLAAAIVALFVATAAAWLAWPVLLVAHVGVFVERWLFFAEAKHVVTLYYPGR